MGKIIKNNVVYGGVPDEVITAWETEDVQDLSELAYGDADISGIGDGSLTGAIAEHESEINTLNSKIVTDTKSNTLTSIAAGGSATVAIGVTKTGYTPVGIITVTKSGAGNGSALITAFGITDSTAAYVSFYNMSSSALSNIGVNITVLYMKA